MRAVLRWANGRVDRVDDIADEVQVLVRQVGTTYHHFGRTSEADTDGCRVFDEQPAPAPRTGDKQSSRD